MPRIRRPSPSKPYTPSKLVERLVKLGVPETELQKWSFARMNAHIKAQPAPPPKF